MVAASESHCIVNGESMNVGLLEGKISVPGSYSWCPMDRANIPLLFPPSANVKRVDIEGSEHFVVSSTGGDGGGTGGGCDV